MLTGWSLAIKQAAKGVLMKFFRTDSILKKYFLVSFLCFGFLGFSNLAFSNLALAQVAEGENYLDELDPFDVNIQDKLNQLDESYLKETGQSPLVEDEGQLYTDCFRQTCTIWAHVVKSQQKVYLYINGSNEFIWDVSTGVEGRETPDFDKHPNGRIYDRYTSTTYPGGDYNGLGNMPYAVFIRGGFAIHGTGVKNWPKLGHPASHGCIRLHPDNAKYFNRLVRQFGIGNTWITVE